MENKPVLTLKDLAKRWNCSENSLRKRVNSGELKYIKQAPIYRFSLAYIQELEEADCDWMSPLERRRLEKEVEVEKQKVEFYKMKLKELTGTAIKVKLELDL